ncbi:MAG TPA: hypothetical protein VHP34_00570 [Alphaproteobacteria bacterium]|nr:hypothetical protein [Alphaproteobacteria bacterium]
MFHISSLFYPKRFRQLITRLKREGTFREQPLKELDRQVYLLMGVFVLLYGLFYFGGDLSVGFSTVFFLVMILGMAFDVRQTIRRIIIPYTVGTIHPFYLADKPAYYCALGGRYGWYITYIVIDEVGNLGKEYTAGRIPKKLFDKSAFMTAPFEALVDPQNPHLNFPCIEKLVQAYRMTTVPLPPPELPEGN